MYTKYNYSFASWCRERDEATAVIEARGKAALERLFPKAAAAGRLKGECYNTRIFLSSFMIKVSCRTCHLDVDLSLIIFTGLTSCRS